MKVFYVICILLSIFLCKSCTKNDVIISQLIYNKKETSDIKRKISPLQTAENQNFFEGNLFKRKSWRVFKLESKKYKNLNVFSALQNDDIIMILDRNYDLDFSNDEKIVFKGFKKLNRSQVANNKQLNNKSLLYSDKNNQPLKIYPIPNYFTRSSDSISNQLQIVVEPVGFFKSDLITSNTTYEIKTKHEFNNDEFEFYIKDLYPNDTLFENDKTIPYLIGDKILLDNKNYFVENYDIKNNKLKFLKNNKISNIGIRKGFVIQNLSLTQINHKVSKINELFDDNDYLLIDFWGTWCAPCIELMPRLNRIHKTKNNIKLLGFALDEDLDRVKSHLQNEEAFYAQTFISFKEAKLSKSIINKWRIFKFPYYILINKDREIIGRGSGKDFLDQLEKLKNF